MGFNEKDYLWFMGCIYPVIYPVSATINDYLPCAISYFGPTEQITIIFLYSSVHSIVHTFTLILNQICIHE